MKKVNMNWNSDLSLDAEKLLNVTSVDVDIIIKKYNVTPKELKNIINLIKDWYEKQPHLPANQLNDRLIVHLLISTKFRIEKVKDKIDASISAKHKMPEILLNRDSLSKNVDDYLRYGFFAVLPKKSPDNHRVSIFRMKSPFEVIVTDAIKIALMVLDYRNHNDVCFGEQYIFDLTHVSFSMSVQMTPALVTKILYYIQFCFGAKIKGIHLINMPAFIAPIVGLVKRLLKPKLAERIHLYRNPEDLQNIFPKNILPKEFGGDEFSFHEVSENWMKVLQSDTWRQHFLEEDKLLSDETKRARALICDDFYGCEGSFRKLEFD